MHLVPRTRNSSLDFGCLSYLSAHWPASNNAAELEEAATGGRRPCRHFASVAPTGTSGRTRGEAGGRGFWTAGNSRCEKQQKVISLLEFYSQRVPHSSAVETYQSTSRTVFLSAAPLAVGVPSQAPSSTGWLATTPREGEAGRKWSRYLRVTERSCCLRPAPWDWDTPDATDRPWERIRYQSQILRTKWQTMVFLVCVQQMSVLTCR